MGSPRPDAQQIPVRPAVTRLFIHSLLLQQGAVCAAHVVKAAFLMSSSSAASFPVSLFPSPLSLAVSSPSIPFPQLFPASPPSVRLIRLYAAKHKFTGRGTEGEREGSEAETVRTEREQNRQQMNS